MELQLLSWHISIRHTQPPAADLAVAYDRLARQWSRKIRQLGYERAYRQLWQRLAPILLPAQKPDLTLLDAGIGTGALTLALVKAVTVPPIVHGVDIAPNMLAEARRHFATAGHTLITEVRDVRALTYAKDTFDLVVSAHTLEHLPQPQQGMRELVRVLRPGAPLLLITTRPGWASNWLVARWGLNRISQVQMNRWLTDAGMTHIQFHQMPGPLWCRRLSYSCTAWKPSHNEGVMGDVINLGTPPGGGNTKCGRSQGTNGRLLHL